MSMTFSRRLLCLLCACALSALVRAEPYQWKGVAINGGGFISGTLYHPKKEGVAYVRTDVGGAYRWDPVYRSWVALNDDITMNDSQLTGVFSFAVDPNDADALYLACGQYLPWWARGGAILRSHDRGRTWARTELAYNAGAGDVLVKLGGNADGRSAGERLQVDPNNGSILFLGTNQDGLFKSTDRGVTWTKVTSFPGAGVSVVAFDASSGTSGNATPVVYAGVDTRSGPSLYKSADGGASWSVVAGYPNGLGVYRAVVDAAGTVFATFTDNLGPNGVSRGSVWKISASGTWTNISPPTGQGGFAGVSLDVSAPGTLVVSTLNRWNTGDVIYRSTDAGAHWTLVLDRNKVDVSQAGWAKDSSPHWIGDVQVNPFNPNEAMLITGYGLLSTANLAAANPTSVTWSFANRGIEETVPLVLVSPPSGPSLVSAIGDIDGFQHFDLDTAPASRLKPLIGTNRSLDFAGTAPTVFARLSDSAGQYSTNGGDTWTAFPAKPATTNGTGNIAVNASGTRFLWAPVKATVQVSSNSGTSWTAATGLPSAANAAWIPVADKVNANKVYVYDQNTAKVYKSTDGGSSFTAGGGGFPTNYSGQMKAVPGVDGELWIAVWNSGLYRSTDSGAAFTKLSNVENAYRVGFGKAAPGQSAPAVFLFGKIGGLDGLYRSDDSGATWVLLNDAAHQFGYINDITGDPRVYGRIYVATGGRGILYGDFAAPVITAHPQSASVEQGFGFNYSLGVTAAGDGLTYQWYRNGAVLAGATEATYTMSEALAGDYQVVVSGLGGQATSRFARITTEVPGPAKLVNMSIRAVAGHNGNPLICGFVSLGGNKTLLLRVAGPSLGEEPFNVAGVMADPSLRLYHSVDGVGVAGDFNDNWADGGLVATLSDAFAQAGAFPFANNAGHDSAMITQIDGPYTAHANSVQAGASGVVLVEGYDLESGTSRRLINVSARNFCGTGADIMIAGFVVRGHQPLEVLVRGIGPTLAAFGVPSALPDSKLELHGRVNGEAVMIASNDDWATEPGVAAAAVKAGAFALASSSADSAILMKLPAGDYTAQLSGAAGTTGEGLIEVYEVY